MGDPKIHFDGEHLRLDITGLSDGWTLGQLGQLKLMDHAQVQFPSDWDHIKIGAATHLLDYSWSLHGQLVIDTAVTAGFTYATAAGLTGTFGVESDAHLYVLHTPPATIDLSATAALNGTLSASGAEVTPTWGVKLSVKF